MPAHIERVSERDRNDVYTITLECGCVVKYEPDASAPHDWIVTEPCEADDALHYTTAIAKAQQAMEGAQDTRPSIGERHPMARAAHAINNAAQIALFLSLADETDVVINDLGGQTRRIVDLIKDAETQITRAMELFQRQERVIEEMRVENIREKQYAERVEHKNSELAQGIVTLTRQLDDAHAVTCEVRDVDLPHELPRLVAAGSR